MGQLSLRDVGSPEPPGDAVVLSEQGLCLGVTGTLVEMKGVLGPGKGGMPWSPCGAAAKPG